MRFDLFIHLPEERGGRLERIEALLKTILQKEIQQVALDQEILAKITSQSTIIDGIKALIDDWVDGNVLTDEQAAAIRAALDSNTTKLEAALAAGTTPPPPPNP